MKIDTDKKRFLIYVIVLILSVIFASFYGGPVSFVWLHAMLLLLPVSFCYIFFSFRFLAIYQEIEVHKVLKGEVHNYRIFLENTGIFPIHNMTFGLYKDRCRLMEISEKAKISLDIHEKKELCSPMICSYAGAYNVGVEHLIFQDPFKIFRVIFDVPYSFRAIVSPRITDVAESSLDIENTLNSTGFKSTQLFEEIPGSDFRAYQAGDNLSMINWKMTARFGEPYARIPDRMEKRSVTILLDAVDSKENEMPLEALKKRDFFLEFAVSAAWHFGRQNVPVKLIFPAGEVKEVVVDSYDTFQDFYNIVSEGIFYNSEKEYEKMRGFIDIGRTGERDGGVFVIIREEKEPGEDYCCILQGA